jgi:hypothetical protein
VAVEAREAEGAVKPGPAPKPRECKNPECGKLFVRRRVGQVVCSILCAGAYGAIRAKRLEDRRQNALRIEQAKAKREAREQLKSLSEVCSDTQVPVNAYVRMRDKHKGCISCSSRRVDDAGHFFPIGSKWRISFLRFNTKLIHGQCRKCNSYTGGGNLHGYIEGIKVRYGEEYLAEMYEIKRLAEQGEERVTREALNLIAGEHRAKLREMRKAA